MSSIPSRLLQVAVAICACVPVIGGIFGTSFGGAQFSPDVEPAVQNHINYLSGLLLGIGLGFWSCIPDITNKGPRMRMLTVLVVIGGIMRFGHSVALGFFPPATIFPLCMELIVAPLLCAWQCRISGTCRWPF